MKNIIIIALLTITTLKGFCQVNDFKIKIQASLKDARELTKPEFTEASKKSFQISRNYPPKTLLYKSGDVLVAVSEELVSKYENYDLETKKRDLLGMLSKHSQIVVEKSETKNVAGKKFVVIRYKQLEDNFITFFSDKGSNGKYLYGNIQFDQSDKTKADAVLSRLLN